MSDIYDDDFNSRLKDRLFFKPNRYPGQGRLIAPPPKDRTAQIRALQKMLKGHYFKSNILSLESLFSTTDNSINNTTTDDPSTEIVTTTFSSGNIVIEESETQTTEIDNGCKKVRYKARFR